MPASLPGGKTMIEDSRIGPQAAGPPDGLVVFFHGYGANGREMAGYVGSQLAPLLPSAALRFPDGHRPVPWGTEGRSWFMVEDMLDMPDGNVAGPRALQETPMVNDYIDRIIREENIPASRVIIAGFSQGGTMAFFAALTREIPVAGVFSISGGALDQLASPRSRPPVMLLAGEREDSFYSGRQLAQKTHHLLLQRGFDSHLLLTPENGHNIDRRSIEELARFARTALTAPAARNVPPAPGFG